MFASNFSEITFNPNRLSGNSSNSSNSNHDLFKSGMITKSSLSSTEVNPVNKLSLKRTNSPTNNPYHFDPFCESPTLSISDGINNLISSSSATVITSINRELNSSKQLTSNLTLEGESAISDDLLVKSGQVFLDLCTSQIENSLNSVNSCTTNPTTTNTTSNACMSSSSSCNSSGNSITNNNRINNSTTLTNSNNWMMKKATTTMNTSVFDHSNDDNHGNNSKNNNNEAMSGVVRTPVHPRTTLKCPFCDKIFSNSSAIAKHKLTHSEERKYICGICHKAFKRQDHLNGHKYTHESRKPHACHFCDKSYSDSRSLRRHYENAHPEENERWMLLCQATNGDTSAISVAAAAAAAALLSSTTLEADPALLSELSNAVNSSIITTSGSGDGVGSSSNSSTGSNESPLTLLTALSSTSTSSSSSLSPSSSVNKLIELGQQTGLSPAALVALVASTGSTSSLSSSIHRLERSSASKISGNTSSTKQLKHISNSSVSGKNIRSDHSMLNNSPSHSPHSLASFSNTISPNGNNIDNMDITDNDEVMVTDEHELSDTQTSVTTGLINEAVNTNTTSNTNNNNIVKINNFTLNPIEVANAAKVALLMAHPLEEPKRVACAICQKRFKNQSALNGHMRLHGGYGPAGLTGITTNSTVASSSSSSSTQSNQTHHHRSNSSGHGSSKSVSKLTDPGPYRTTSSNNNSGNNNNVNNNSDLKNKSSSTLTDISTLKSSSSQLSQLDTITASHTSLESISSVITTNTNTTYSCIMDNTSSSTPNVDTSGSISITVTTTPRTRDLTTTTTTAASSSLNNNNNNMDISSSLFNSAIVSQSNSENLHPSNNQSQINNTWSYIANKQILESTFNTSLHHSNISGTCGSDDTSVPLNRHKLQLQSENLTNNSISNQNCQQLSLYNSWLSPQFTVSSESVHSSSQHHQHQHQSLQHFHMDLSNFDDVIDINKKDNNNNSNNNSGLTSPRHHGSMDDESLLKYNRRLSFVCSSNMKMMTTTPGITTSTVTAIDSCHGHQFHSVTTPSVSATATLFDKHCMTSKTTSLASIHCLSTTITDRFNNSQKSELLGLMDTDDWWHPEIGNSLNSSNNINNNRGNNSNRSLNTNSFDQKWLSFENMTSLDSNNNNNNPKGITSFELFDTSDQKQTITIPPNIHLASRLKSENNQCHNSSVSSSLSAPFLLNQLSSSSSSSAAASSSSCAWSTQRKQTKSGFVRPIPQPLQLVSEANYQPQLGISSQYSPITPAPMNMSMHTIITDCETISSSSTLTTMKASNSVNVDPGLFHNDDEHQYRLIEGIVECNNNANTKSSVCCFDANGLDLSHFPDSLLLTSIYGSNTTTTTNSNNNNDHTNFIYPVDDNCSNDNLCKAIPIVSVSMSSGKVDSDIPLVNCANQSNDHLINLSQKRTDTNLQRYLHHHHPSTVPPPPPHHIHRQRQANNDGSSSSSICDSHGDCSVCCPIPKFSNPFEYSQHLHQHQQQQPERQVYQRQQSHSHLPHQHQQNICPVPALQSGISLSLSSYHHSGLQQHHDQGSSNHINNYDNGNNNIITRRITDPFVHTCSQYSHHQPTTINHLAGMNFMRHSLHQLNIPSIQSCNVTFTTCNSLLSSGCCPRINMTSSSSSCASSMIISSGLSSVRSSNFTHSVTSAIAAAVTTTTSTTVSPNNANNDHYSSANNFFNFTSDRLHYKPLPLRQQQQQQQQDLHSHLHQPPTMYQMISSNRGVESSSERVENTHLFNGSELMLNNKFHSVGNPSPPSHHHYNHPCQSNNNTNHNYKNLFTINNQSDSLVKHTYRNQCCLSCLEPERKRHISAPVANISSQSPFLLSLSALSVSTSLSSSSSLSYSPSSLFSSSTFPGNLSTLQRPVATGPKSEFLNKPCFCLQECHHHYHQHRNNNNNNHHYHDHHQQQHSHCCAGLSSNELTSGVSVEQPSSDTVAELLMQSHITDPDGLSLTCEQQNSCPTTPDPPLTPIRSTTRIVVLPTNDQSLSTEDDHHHLNNNTNNTDDKYVYRHGNLTSHKSNIFSCSKPSIPSTLQSSPPLPQHKHHQHYQLHPLQPQSLSCLSCADSNNEQYQQRNYSQPPPYQYQQQQHQKLSVSLNLPVTTCSMSNLNQLDLLDLTVTSVMQNINDNNTTTINNNHNNADNLKNNTVVNSITCLDNNDHNTSNNNNVMSKYISDSDDHSGGHLSVAAKLSKSLAEDNLFRNPKALPPPKKLKSKPAPISIPPQTGANLSRLRSPRVWSSKGCSLDSSPPPYTPPPMLSPNRQGSGLFASLSRWSTTPTTSALTTLRSTVGYNNTILNRRYSSHYSSTGVAGTTSLSNSVYNDLDNQNNATGGQLKRRHASSSCSSGGTIGITASNQSINTMMDPGSSSADNHHNYDGNGDNINSGAVDSITDSYMRDLNRPIAYTRRRRQQLTPKSAPVLILNPNTNKNQTTQSRDVLQENDSINQSQPPIFSSSDTIFGYDDETMRRFAEADAVDEAYRLNRQKQRRDNHHSRRRCDTESNLSNITSIDHKTDTFNSNTVNDRLIFNKTDQSFNFAEEQLLNFDFEMKAVETNYSEATRIQFNEDVDFSSEGEMEDDDDDDEGVPTSIIPHINVGNAYQADIPEFCQAQESTTTTTTTPGKQDSSEWETLLWYPANLDEDDPKNIESLNLLMKIACSPAVRNCGLNMEYTFHLLCKYKGDLEMTLHALLRDTLVVYDYVYAETTAWTTEEIVRFQQGLAMHGRDFHQVAKYLQAAGMNKTVKACVEFYYVWKRMNTPSDVKWYRDRARRQRTTTTTTSATRIEPIITEESLCEQFEAIEQQCNTFTDVNAIQSLENNSTTNVPYNLRRKHTTTTSATVSGTVTTQQLSIPVTAAPPPSANSRLHELVPVNNDSINNNNSGNTNDDNQMNNNSNDNVLENSYDDFMDIVFNDETEPIDGSESFKYITTTAGGDDGGASTSQISFTSPSTISLSVVSTSKYPVALSITSSPSLLTSSSSIISSSVLMMNREQCEITVYTCHICDKIFNKIKSRNAHMKTHSDKRYQNHHHH